MMDLSLGLYYCRRIGACNPNPPISLGSLSTSKPWIPYCVDWRVHFPVRPTIKNLLRVSLDSLYWLVVSRYTNHSPLGQGWSHFVYDNSLGFIFVLFLKITYYVSPCFRFLSPILKFYADQRTIPYFSGKVTVVPKKTSITNVEQSPI